MVQVLLRDLFIDRLCQALLQPLSKLSEHLFLLMRKVLESLLPFKCTFHALEVILTIVCIDRRSDLSSHARRHDLVKSGVPLLVPSLLASALNLFSLFLIFEIEKILLVDSSVAD